MSRRQMPDSVGVGSAALVALGVILIGLGGLLGFALIQIPRSFFLALALVVAMVVLGWGALSLRLKVQDGENAARRAGIGYLGLFGVVGVGALVTGMVDQTLLVALVGFVLTIAAASLAGGVLIFLARRGIEEGATGGRVQFSIGLGLLIAAGFIGSPRTLLGASPPAWIGLIFGIAALVVLWREPAKT